MNIVIVIEMTELEANRIGRTGRLRGRGTEGAGRLRTQRVGGTEGQGGTVVHSPLSSAVVEGPGTWLAAMSLTTNSQQQTD